MEGGSRGQEFCRLYIPVLISISITTVGSSTHVNFIINHLGLSSTDRLGLVPLKLPGPLVP